MQLKVTEQAKPEPEPEPEAKKTEEARSVVVMEPAPAVGPEWNEAIAEMNR